MPAYLDLVGLKAISDMPGSYFDALEAKEPGWIAGMLEDVSAHVDARLRKRYGAPFATPYPVAVKGWVAHIATLRAWKKRGVNPSDPEFAEYRAAAERAEAEILEAANSDTGLFDLPVLPTPVGGASAISRGTPLGYAEASPYVWTDEQYELGSAEDAAVWRRGTV